MQIEQTEEGGNEGGARSDGSACCFSSSEDAEIWLWIGIPHFNPPA